MAHTQDQLMIALRNADAAGDVEGARRIAAMIQQSRPEQAAELTPTQKLFQNTGEGSPISGVPSGQGFATPKTIATVAASGLAKPVAGYAGALAAPFVGMEGAAGVVDVLEEKLTPQSDDPRVQAQLASLAEIPGLKQLGQGLEAYEEGFSKPLSGALGEVSPEAGAVVRGVTGVVPDAMMSILGLKGGQVAANQISKLGPAVENVVKNITNEPEVKVFSETGDTLFSDEAIEAVSKSRQEMLDNKPGVAEKAQEMADSGEFKLDEIDKFINEQLGIPDVLNPSQMRNMDAFGRLNVPPLRANVTQTADDWRELQELVKFSNDASRRVAVQDQNLFEAAQNGLDKIGRTADDLGETNNMVRQTIDDYATSLDDSVRDAYQVAREIAPDAQDIKLDGFMKNFMKSRGEEALTGGLISSLRGHLKNIGMLDSSGRPVRTDKMTTEMIAERGLPKMNVQQAERLRQFLNTKFDGATPAAKSIIKELKDSIDEDVIKVVGEDVFKDARQKKIGFHDSVEMGKKGRFDKRKGSLLEDILYGKTDEGVIVDKIVKAGPDDLDHIKKFLTQDAGDSGLEAWQNIKAQILSDAIEKAKVGKVEGGDFRFSDLKFKSALAPILRNSKKKNSIFNKDERQLIDDILEVGRARMPMPSVQQGFGPSSGGMMSSVMSLIGPDKVQLLGGAKALYKNLSDRGEIKRQTDVTKETEKVAIEALRPN